MVGGDWRKFRFGLGKFSESFHFIWDIIWLNLVESERSFVQTFNFADFQYFWNFDNIVLHYKKSCFGSLNSYCNGPFFNTINFGSEDCLCTPDTESLNRSVFSTKFFIYLHFFNQSCFKNLHHHLNTWYPNQTNHTSFQFRTF